MLQMYAIAESLYCAKLRIVMRHKGLQWSELEPPGGYGSPEYKALVPAGNLPALRDGDLLIADSEAIAEYLEETFPEPAMLPASPAARAMVRARSRHHDTRLEPAVRRLFPHVGKRPVDREAISSIAADIQTRVDQLGDVLRHAPPGPGLALGDCGYPITAAWVNGLASVMGFAVVWPETVTSYLAHLARQPAVAEEMASYGPVLAAWIARKTG
ncbi:MAG: glutathione S-transferase [Rhizobiales bacterium]|nr:glutathione S-transferase [Hyphomicrobiales bacterium]